MGQCGPGNSGVAAHRLPVVGRGGVVPYIARWSEEKELPARIIECAGSGIAFAGETASDRDRYGVLWTRMTAQPGRGRPQFAVIHSLRQRRAMRRLLCQICAQPADRNEDGVLWLLPDYQHGRPGWPKNVDLPEPPVCLACASIAIRLCPALRKGHVAVRVRHAPIHGVKGLVYRAGHPQPIIVRDEIVAYGSPAMRWTLAEQLGRTLRECTVVRLDHRDRHEDVAGRDVCG